MEKFKIIKDFENCSVGAVKDFGEHIVYFLISKYTCDKNFSKKGDVSHLTVIVSNNYDYYFDQCEYWIDFEEEKEYLNMGVFKMLDPILAVKYYGHNCYFYPELMNGTQTDEQQSSDFCKYLLLFEEIALDVFGTPHWYDEKKKIITTKLK